MLLYVFWKIFQFLNIIKLKKKFIKWDVLIFISSTWELVHSNSLEFHPEFATNYICCWRLLPSPLWVPGILFLKNLWYQKNWRIFTPPPKKEKSLQFTLYKSKFPIFFQYFFQRKNDKICWKKNTAGSCVTQVDV